MPRGVVLEPPRRPAQAQRHLVGCWSPVDGTNIGRLKFNVLWWCKMCCGKLFVCLCVCFVCLIAIGDMLICLLVWLVGCLFACLRLCLFVVCLFLCLVGWLAGWLVGWLVGWSVGRSFVHLLVWLGLAWIGVVGCFVCAWICLALFGDWYPGFPLGVAVQSAKDQPWTQISCSRHFRRVSCKNEDMFRTWTKVLPTGVSFTLFKCKRSGSNLRGCFGSLKRRFPIHFAQWPTASKWFPLVSFVGFRNRASQIVACLSCHEAPVKISHALEKLTHST